MCTLNQKPWAENPGPRTCNEKPLATDGPGVFCYREVAANGGAAGAEPPPYSYTDEHKRAASCHCERHDLCEIEYGQTALFRYACRLCRYASHAFMMHDTELRNKKTAL